MPAIDDANPDVPCRGWRRSASRALWSSSAGSSGLLSSRSSAHSPAPSPPGCSLSSTSPSLAAPCATCSCAMPLWASHDALGDHIASCPRSGALRARGGPLEPAAVRVCREAGGRHALGQLAVESTHVSPPDASGAAPRHQRQYRGEALRLARRA